MRRNLVIVMFVVFLSACGAAKGPMFDAFVKPDESGSVLYIYRPKKFVGGGAYPRIKVAELSGVAHPRLNENVGLCHMLKNGAYYRLTVKPGSYNVAMVPGQWKGHKWGDANVTVDIVSGGMAFVKYIVDLQYLYVVPMGPIVYGSSSFKEFFVEVDEETAFKEMEKTKLQSLDTGCDD